MEQKLILTVGDIHGRLGWRDFVFGSIEKHEQWRSAQHKSPIAWENALDTSVSDIDEIVFVGDYHDSFDVSNIIIKHNFLDILYFKRAYPDRVFLLWGNHDVSYWNIEERCSGFRPEVFHDQHEILRSNRDIIDVAHQIGNVLWTHAGVTDNFYKKLCLKKALERKEESKRWESISGEDKTLGLDKTTIASFLNEMWHHNWAALFNVGKMRGGFDNIPGPLWADKNELMRDPLGDIMQFVGHTPVQQIESYEGSSHGGEKNNYLLCFTDTLERGDNQVALVKIVDGKYDSYTVIQK